MSGNSVIKAYWLSGSAVARRILMALEEKGIPYESKLLSFDKGEHKTPELLAINPRGKVPFITDGDVVLYESLAILQYLEKFYPQTPLIPADNKGAAEVLTRMHEGDNFYNICYVAERNAPPKEGSTPEYLAKHNELQQKAYEELKYFEEYLKGKKYLAADKFTLADVAFFPLLDQAVRFGLTFGKFPNLGEYHKLIYTRPSAVKTIPPHWKNGPFPFSPFD